jgi:hypothetical protein
VRRGRPVPSRDTVRRAIAAIKRTADYEYFLDTLRSPGWIDPLREEGFFRHPPEPEREGGFIRFPLWPESRYLARMAPFAPDLVLSLLLSMPDTENVRVQEDVIDAALAMPPATAVKIVSRATSWVDSPYLLLLPEKLGKLVVHLADDGRSRAALRLAKELLKPAAVESDDVAQTGTYPRVPEPQPRYRISAYEQVAKAIVPALAAADHAGTVALLSDLLDLAVRLAVPDATPPNDSSFVWRPAVENHDQNHAVGGVRDVLVEALRDAARSDVASRPEALPGIVAALESRPWRIFHRIALHLLTSELDTGWELARPRVLDRGGVDDVDLYHEYWLLVRAAFPRLRLAEQQAVLDAIASGPNVTRGDDPEGYALHWRFQRLAVLKDVLGQRWRSRYDELVQRLGYEPDHPEFLMYGTAGWVGPTSPKERDDLLAMPVDEVVRFLEEWQPRVDFMAPTPEGLGRALSEAVALEPERFAASAASLRRLHPTYVRSAIQGWRDAVREARPFFWAPILDLCKWVIEQGPGDASDSDDADRDPGWQWTRRAIADLLGAGFGHGRCEIPYALRGTVWAVLEPLTRDPDPTPEHEERYGGSNMDPPTLAINTTRGEGLHSTVRYALWVHRAIKGEDASARVDLMPEVRRVLDEHLRVDRDPSAAIRSTYGQWLPWLALLDARWVEAHLGDIFPEEPRLASLRDAAWEAYIVFCVPYDATFDILREEYRKAIQRLETPASSSDWHPYAPQERLGQHLITLMLRGRIDLSDELVTSFFDHADEDGRQDALAHVGQVLREASNVPTQVVERAMALWQWRFTVAKAQPGSHRKELAAFGWWFASAKFPDSWSLDQLVAALTLTRGKIELDYSVLERLAELAETHPMAAAESVRLIARADNEGWIVAGSRDEIKAILAAGLASKQPDAREAATALVHALGARGYRDFRRLLSRIDDEGQASAN